MENIVAYLKKRGNKTFSERPANEVDYLVLTQFVYLKYDGMVPGLEEGGEGVSIAWLAENQEEEKVFADKRYEKDNRALFAAMALSRRFRHMKVSLWQNLIDEEKETQFCACTCYLEGGPAVVVFRGTDETLVGWKEDFNMAFSSPVPGQQLSVSYLERAAQSITGNFILAGHSKGGNLAVYCAMHCADEVRGRIHEIYSYDGPGFRPEVLTGDRFEKIRDRVRKYLPQSSLIGMLLESQEEYLVVESAGLGGILQHNPFNWIVRGTHFRKVNGVGKGHKLMDESLNEWVLSLDQEQLQEFVNTMYQIVRASHATTLLEFTADWKNCLKAMLLAMEGLDPQTRARMREIVRKLSRILGEKLLVHPDKG